MQHPPEKVRLFFSRSDSLDYLALRPLSHIAANWEATWDGNSYRPEVDSFAADLNVVIEAIAQSPRPKEYHDHEDNIIRKLQNIGWPIQKKGKLWITKDYQHLLEQGAFDDKDQFNLISSAAGRTHAALDRANQQHFDEMDDRHQWMISGIISIIIYHRYADRSSLLKNSTED